MQLTKYPRSARRWRMRQPALSRMSASTLVVLGLAAALQPVRAQRLLRPPQADETVTVLPSDLAVLEGEESRKDLPCTLTQRKTELGFDLRFHAGYDVSIPMDELAGSGNQLTVVFRVYPKDDKGHAAFFVQHFQVPVIGDDAKGEAVLPGGLDIGEGEYHVDWLMRDRAERFCSDSWDLNATLPPKDKPIPLFIKSNEVSEARIEPFSSDSVQRPMIKAERLNLKILVNFAPQLQSSAALERGDVDALVTILKTLERDPHVARISLVAFNMNESRIVYREDQAEQIDFPALGKALNSMRLGTVTVGNLAKHSETDFLEGLIQSEMGAGGHPDAVIFAGPKAMLNADVPQEDLRRIGDIECPVFYLNYNVNPQAIPWKDSISHAIRAFKGTEYTISKPRDLWFSTAEVMARIVRFKRERSVASTSAATVSSGAFRLAR